ncbi:MAG TPA: DUF305 domain-containing protein [Longimicrobiales bacterium]|nr:DUF305 domain-containing protein [Longimicrobiales bacterium]
MRTRILVALLAAPLLTLSACATAGSGGAGSADPPLLGAGAIPAPRPYSQADVHFMAGMIPHHAQAVKMAALVPDRSSREDVKILAERMAVAQGDEIALIRQWLADNNEDVPPADATHHVMDHGGMQHAMLMPGMLTDEEMAQLEAARGAAFDRMFLTLMIRHHEGAIIMVNDLFGAAGAAQDDFIYKFASDVFADQTTEIHHMQQILAQLPERSQP